MLQAGLIYQPLPGHLSHVGLLIVSPGSALGLSHHPHRLPSFFWQHHLVKELRQDVEHPLNLLRLRRGEDVIFGVEKCHHPLHRPLKFSGGRLLCCHNNYLVPYHGIHHYVEDRESRGGGFPV